MDTMKQRVAEAALVALREAGGQPAKVNRAAIVDRFADEGGRRSTLYGWVAAAFAAHEEAKAAASLPPIPIVKYPVAPAFRPEVGGPVVGLSEVMGGSSIAVVEQLMECVKAARDSMAHARHADGRVRISKTLIAASEHLRKTLETAARLHESMVSLQKLDRYMDAMLGEVGKCDAALAARVVNSLRELDTRWRASDGGEKR